MPLNLYISTKPLWTKEVVCYVPYDITSLSDEEADVGRGRAAGFKVFSEKESEVRLMVV